MRGERVAIDSSLAIDIVADIFRRLGCREDTARIVAEQLADASERESKETK